MNKIIFVIVIMLMPSIAWADCSNVYCDAVKIEKMQVNTYDDTVWIATSGVETALNCTPESGIFLHLDTSTNAGRNVYSALLAYKLSNKEIGIRVEASSNPCKILYVVPL